MKKLPCRRSLHFLFEIIGFYFRHLKKWIDTKSINFFFSCSFRILLVAFCFVKSDLQVTIIFQFLLKNYCAIEVCSENRREKLIFDLLPLSQLTWKDFEERVARETSGSNFQISWKVAVIDKNHKKIHTKLKIPLSSIIFNFQHSKII